MARAKNSSKRNGRKRAAPALGIAGVSLAMASGASASTAGSAVDVPVQNTATHHELFLGEEEISDISIEHQRFDCLLGFLPVCLLNCSRADEPTHHGQ